MARLTQWGNIPLRVGTKDDWREIVGVVGDVHEDGMNKDAPTIAYWPMCWQIISRAIK